MEYQLLFLLHVFFFFQPEVKDDPQGQSSEARSANEYEKLAHMCLKQKEQVSKPVVHFSSIMLIKKTDTVA